MKILAVLFLLLTFAAHAKRGVESYMTFVIENDTIDPSLNGDSRLYGYTYEGAGYHPLKDVSVSLLKDSVKIDQRLSNLKGQFFYQTLKPGKYELVTAAGDMVETRSYILELKANQKLKVAFHIMHIMESVSKPVIYLYPEEETEVNLKLHFKGELTYTYPKYSDGWSVVAHPNGKIEANGAQYNYLFWDGKMPRKSLKYQKPGGTMVPRGVGKLIQGKQCEAYLSEVLNDIGFTSIERQDFMTYWIPQLMDSEYLLLRFFVDESYGDKIAEIEVEPKPNSMLRLYMVAEAYTIKPSFSDITPSFEPFVREGFTLVEWGGTLIKSETLAN